MRRKRRLNITSHLHLEVWATVWVSKVVLSQKQITEDIPELLVPRWKEGKRKKKQKTKVIPFTVIAASKSHTQPTTKDKNLIG